MSFSQHWVRKVANNRSVPVGPSTDGQGRTGGHYMIVDSTNRELFKAQLSSNSSAVRQLKRAYFSCQMVFKYYITAKDSDFFSVSVGPNFDHRSTVWRMNGSTKAWIKGSVYVGEHVCALG